MTRAKPFGLSMSVAFIAALVVLSVGGWQILRTRDASLRSGAQNAASLARSLAQHAARTVDAADLALMDAVEQVEAGGAAGALPSYLSRRDALLRQARNFVVLDRQGKRIAGSAPAHRATGSADRDAFAWHRDHTDPGLHIGPMVVGPASGLRGMPISRRIDAADGSFAGVAAAMLSPEYFEAFYQSVKAGPRSALGLWLDDGRLLLRSSLVPTHVLIETTQPRPIAAAVFRGGSGVTRGLSSWDGVERLFAFEHVDGLPLVVSAALAVDDVLADWRHEAIIEAMVVVGAAVVLLGLGLGLEVHRRRLQALNAATREVDRQYRLLADNANDLIVLKPSFDDPRAYVSPASRTVLGWEPGELAALPSAALVHPEDLAAVRADFAALTAENPVLTSLLRVKHKAGHYVWLETVMRRTEDGRVLLSSRDVTARREAEIALADSEARYRLLADHTTDMISHMDLTGRRLFISPGSRGLVGYEPEELIGTSVMDTAHAEDADALREVFAALASGRLTEASHSCRIPHRDGRWIWVEACLKLIRDAAGTPVGLVASVRNIMDRKLADEALRSSEARYRIMAETTSDFITQLDLNMRRQYVSPACRHVLGYEPEELLGQRPSEMMHPDDAGEVRALAARLVRGEIEGGRAAATYRMRHKDGRWIWVEAGINLVRDEVTGAPVSLICSARDVTERLRLSRHLQRAKEVAEEAARVKSDFVANMSHELRTPLTGILGVHDLLKRDATLNDAQRRLVDLASEAGTSLLAIVNDVLDLSKIEAGQLTLERVPFDLDDLVAGCRNLASRGLRGKPIEIRTALPAGLPRRLLGDPTRLRQILLNLLTNAVKFTDEGEVVVAAGYRPETGVLRLDVTDTGIGIPVERTADLFERFTQGDTSMSRRYGGTGLGLAICKRLAILMGGRIGVLPASRGAHFWVELPLPALDGCLARPPDAAAPTPARGAGRHLLLAEDNAINAEIIATMLRAQHYRVTTVANGAAAAAMITGACDVDLVLMDLQMPVMDGVSATAAIREHEAAHGSDRMPIIGLTANALAEDATRCFAAGMDGHVAKPIVWPTLFAAIDRCLGSAAAPPLRAAS